ncbi:S-adenosyl-L-methionine-dependent methyltransferase [Saccharata proteae CBS 121410]|uniref:S-adenosyl-L-methionine-dependent methyltransferase n=1 Tax=Saccharata proteae CBS 121410 TaxID=1314787 RepID=A0A9P4HML9_9PEZI|nr:S-adenosyl-L-methionine-dependent methyltransferase [Saccharata proteae CBS 121410]
MPSLTGDGATAAQACSDPAIIGENLEVDSSWNEADSTFGDCPDSATTSLASDVVNYRYEHGRRYHAIEDGRYTLPNDEEEADRLNLQHRVWDIALNKRLFLAPLDLSSVHEVLDIGCGTGAWCIDFADAHPSISVLGTDLSPIQPTNVPPNCEFIVENAESEWTYGPRFDLIHSRAITIGIRDWNALVRQCFDSLKPGGWVEFQEFHLPVGCDDETAGPDAPVTKWSAHFCEAVKTFGIDVRASLGHAERLRQAGFEQVEEAHIKMPLGSWAKGKKEKRMGALFQRDIADNVYGVSVKAFTQGLGWSVEAFEEFIPKVRKDLLDPQIHCYFPTDIFWARKPL